MIAPMRIAVTGASGFIGSALAPALERRGHEVLAVARGAALPGGCEVLVHLANLAHARVAPALLQAVNVDGTRRVAEAAAAAGVRRMVYLSSVKALADRDRYADSKRAAEAALREVRGIEIVVLRPPLVYGPGVRANFLALLRAIARGLPLPLASVRNRRSLVYVGNLCDAIARCLEAPRATGAYGVSDGGPLSTPELCRAIGAALGRPARLFPWPPALLELVPGMTKLTRSLEVDDAPLRRELGWAPPFTAADGLRDTARWYLGRR
jgi:nucleoside-diphosphate-sugar epimerase